MAVVIMPAILRRDNPRVDAGQFNQAFSQE
jgi:hypothetical protein